MEGVLSAEYDHPAEIVKRPSTPPGNDNPGPQQPIYPAAYSEVIAVGATDSSDQVPYWINRNVELTAPGVEILSTYPGDTYQLMSGTSIAAPHVSGAAALLQLASYSTSGKLLTTSALRNILHSTVDDKGGVGYDTIYGYGIVWADRAVSSLTS